MTKTSAQPRRLGDVVRIPLESGYSAYALVLKEATVAVYDIYAANEISIEQLEQKPILFYVAVMDYAIKRGRWKIVGNIPLGSIKADPPPKFIQDPLNKENFNIYEGGQIRLASRSECRNLERASVWDPKHVEDRIRDHFAGRPNKWVESLKLRE